MRISKTDIKSVSAIPVGSKRETRYSCYSHLERHNWTLFIMEEILSQLMMSVTVCDGPNVTKVSAMSVMDP